MTKLPTTIALLLLAACSPDAPPRTAADTVAVAIERLAGERDPGVLWDLLPASYRRDLRTWTHQCAGRLPPAVYDKLFRTLRKAGVVIKSKAEFLLDTPMFRMLLRGMRNADDDEILAVFESIGNTLILLGRSEIATVEKLRSCDPGAFLHGTGKAIWTHGARAFRITGREIDAGLTGLRYRTLQASADRAQLQFDTPAGPGSTAGSWSLEFVRVEGVWTPAPLATAWPDLQPGLTAALEQLGQPATQATLRQLDGFLDTVLADLDKIQATESRSAFGSALQEIGTRYGKELRGLFGKLPFPR